MAVTFGERQAVDRTTLVPEDGPRYSFRGGVLEIRGGGGWLRTSRVYLNFRVAFEFRSATPELDAGLLIRTWTGRGGWPGTGYRIRLPTDSVIDPSAVLVGHRQRVVPVEKGQIILKPADEWQHLEVTAERTQITIVMNGTRVGVFQVESYGGHVLFDSKKGVVQLRTISIASTEPEPEVPPHLTTSSRLTPPDGKSPKLISEVRPHYTTDAMREKVQGVVNMDIVVLPDGTVGPVRITRSLHRDLDLSAMAAVRAWRFEPAMLNGKKVPAVVEVEMSFKLR